MNIRARLEGREVVWLVDFYWLQVVIDKIGGAVRTTGDDRLEVDDCVSEGGAVEGLPGYFEGGEEEWRGHHREVLMHVAVSVLLYVYGTVGRFGRQFAGAPAVPVQPCYRSGPN